MYEAVDDVRAERCSAYDACIIDTEWYQGRRGVLPPALHGVLQNQDLGIGEAEWRRRQVCAIAYARWSLAPSAQWTGAKARGGRQQWQEQDEGGDHVLVPSTQRARWSVLADRWGMRL